MAFSDLNWNQRFESMGDETEGIFEEMYPEQYVRFGFNRPPFSIAKMPLQLRYAPDYIEGGIRFVECQGIGAAGLKVKIEKLMALQHWDLMLPVHFFIWSRPKEMVTEFTLKELLKYAGQEKASLGAYTEGKPYLRFTPGVFQWKNP